MIPIHFIPLKWIDAVGPFDEDAMHGMYGIGRKVSAFIIN